jgi:hypothetical protein
MRLLTFKPIVALPALSDSVMGHSGSWRDRLEYAGRRGGEVEQQIVEEFRAALASGDAEAVEIYREHQDEALGPEPLAVGACEWPDELSEPGNLIDVPRSAPLLGWRYWRVCGSYLAAPFLTVEEPGNPARGNHKTRGLGWKPGVNTASAAWCQGTGQHPLPGCACGIRACQSRTLIDRFAAAMEERLGGEGAIARVAVWGRVASYRADDDWRHTLRAQHARIVGPLELTTEHEQHRAAIERRYKLDRL